MARVVEIVSGVYEIAGLAPGRMYLVEADGLGLIDTNNPSRADAIVAALEASGRSVGAVRHIVVTHWHQDHTGNLSTLAERTGARVSVGAGDAPYVRGDKEPPPYRRAGFSGLLLAPLLNARRQREAHPVHQELRDGDELDIAGGMRVIATPGHTPGHISLLLPEWRLLFAGDAYFNWPGLRMGFAASTHDPEQAMASLRKLAKLDFEVACFGHGPPITRGAADTIRRFAERLRPEASS